VIPDAVRVVVNEIAGTPQQDVDRMIVLTRDRVAMDHDAVVDLA
jgi:hypothetical protein